jgi:hypothetical protein
VPFQADSRNGGAEDGEHSRLPSSLLVTRRGGRGRLRGDRLGGADDDAGRV